MEEVRGAGSAREVARSLICRADASRLDTGTRSVERPRPPQWWGLVDTTSSHGMTQANRGSRGRLFHGRKESGARSSRASETPFPGRQHDLGSGQCWGLAELPLRRPQSACLTTASLPEGMTQRPCDARRGSGDGVRCWCRRKRPGKRWKKSRLLGEDMVRR